MSFVICCATSEYGVIASDGRVVEFNAEDKVVRDDFQKVRRINDDLIVGFAGDEEMGESGISVVNNKYADRRLNVDNFANAVHAFLIYEHECGTDLGNTVFFVLGRDGCGFIKYYVVSSVDGIKKSEYIPTSPDVPRISYAGCKVSKDTYVQIHLAIQDYGVEKGLTQVIHRIADTQATVGREVYILSL